MKRSFQMGVPLSAYRRAGFASVRSHAILYHFGMMGTIGGMVLLCFLYF